MELLRMENRPVMATHVALLLLISVSVAGILGIVDGQSVQPSLSTKYYNKSCPKVTSIVDQVVLGAITQSRNIVGGLLRLHFHDCFVRGCDASVLIDSVPPLVAEKDGPGNADSLRGFEVIDNVKNALELACPGIVSCADILALVAQSAVVQIGGPSWLVPLGRRDGNVSNAADTSANLPSFTALYAELKGVFASKGLNEQDMVALSGAHTIGNTHCNKLQTRLYNSTGPGGVDPTLDSSYAAQLKSQCPYTNSLSMTIVPMDPTLGGDTFDSNYYSNVLTKRGLFISDATLPSTAKGAALVGQDSSSAQFFADFAQSMTKMGSISVLFAPEGDIRRSCRSFNPPSSAPVPALVPSVSTPTPVPPPSPVSTPPTVSPPAPNSTPTTVPLPDPIATAPPALPPAATPPTPAPVTVATTPKSAGRSSTSPAAAPPVPTSPASASPVPASPAPTPIPSSSSPPPPPAPVAKSPPPPRISTSSSPPATKSTAPARAQVDQSSSSRTSSPSPIFCIAVKAAEVFIRLLHY